MKKIIWGYFCTFILLVSGLFQSTYAAETTYMSQPDEQQILDIERALYAKAAVLMDASSGRVLFGKNESELLAMASTTKILTCILVLENANPEDEIEVSAYAASMPKVKLNVRKGENYKIRDLLYSLMLESHNDSAVVLAENIGKKFLHDELAAKSTTQYSDEESKMAVAEFAKMMNKKAVEIGCEDSWFITPNGLDATQELWIYGEQKIIKKHSTTAKELALILSYCILQSDKKDEFLEITQTRNYSFEANQRSFTLVNHNAFLNMMEGALSGKTGFTNQAGYCYVGALKRENRIYIVALLACGWPNHKDYKWRDTKKLMQYGLEHFTYKSFLDSDIRFDEASLSPIPVLNGQTNEIGDQACVEVRLVDYDNNPMRQKCDGILIGEDEKIDVIVDIATDLVAPVSEGTEIGRVKYQLEGVTYREEALVTDGQVSKIDFMWCLNQVLQMFTI